MLTFICESLKSAVINGFRILPLKIRTVFKFPAKKLRRNSNLAPTFPAEIQIQRQNFKISNLAPKSSKFQIWRQNSQNFKFGAKIFKISNFAPKFSKFQIWRQNARIFPNRRHFQSNLFKRQLPGAESEQDNVQTLCTQLDNALHFAGYRSGQCHHHIRPHSLIIRATQKFRLFTTPLPWRPQTTHSATFVTQRTPTARHKKIFFFLKKKEASRRCTERAPMENDSRHFVFIFKKSKLSIRHESRPAANF